MPCGETTGLPGHPTAGRVDPLPSAGAYGVVDEIAGRVLLSGGHVLAVRRDDIPGGGSVAALLRFAI